MIKIEVFYSGSSGNMYLVSNEDTKILLECGVDKETIIKTLWKNQKTNLSKLNACLVSHKHKDHIESIEYVNKFIPVYANEEVYSKCLFKGFILTNNANFEIGSIKIKPIDLKHGKTANLGFIFKDKDNTIFFGTDFSHIKANLSQFKFNKIYIEINYINSILEKYIDDIAEEEKKSKYIRQINTHMSLENVCQMILDVWDLSKCEEIIGIHMSLDCGSASAIRSVIEKKYNIPCKIAKPRGGFYD